ncbi:response regulator [Asticcacaulis sp. AC460]|uniref:response regulator n=1 Tax=Asticcacaulis sp. AC460 TaxID=1282360 RepID=UPI000419C5BB|nr:response regulator [Asticcacaulis sp. AC460]
MVGLQNCKILIVDSNAHMRQILETVLRGFGARRIFTATSAEEAEIAMERSTYDIILLDYVLEGGDGLAVTRRVRAKENHANRFSPIIVISGSTERSRIEAARDAGINEVCVKPVIPKELFRKLVAVVDYPRCFVLAPNYKGPDRRRRSADNYPGEERRADRKAARRQAMQSMDV